MTVYSLFLETDYVSFQKNELVVSDNEHDVRLAYGLGGMERQVKGKREDDEEDPEQEHVEFPR